MPCGYDGLPCLGPSIINRKEGDCGVRIWHASSVSVKNQSNTSSNVGDSLIITIAFRLANFNSGGFTTNPTLLQAKFLAWTQTELSYSIMAATIPSLRSFIKSLATNYGSTTVDGYGSTYGSGYANNGAEGDMQSGSYQMHSFRPKGKGDEYKYRIWTTKADNSGKSTEVNKTDTGSMASSESQRMIIQKNLVWEVVVDPK